MLSLQLVTQHLIASDFAKSFTVSVLPVPAGPAGALYKELINTLLNKFYPPSLKVKAVVKVITHLSVKGVITNLPFNP